MGKFHILRILQENALFSGKIYTVGNIFTRPPVVTNFKSDLIYCHFYTPAYYEASKIYTQKCVLTLYGVLKQIRYESTLLKACELCI